MSSKAEVSSVVMIILYVYGGVQLRLTMQRDGDKAGANRLAGTAYCRLDRIFLLAADV